MAKLAVPEANRKFLYLLINIREANGTPDDSILKRRVNQDFSECTRGWMGGVSVGWLARSAAPKGESALFPRSKERGEIGKHGDG